MRKYRIGRTLIEISDEDQCIRITLPKGAQIPAAPQDNDEYRKNAADHGYGDEVWNFCIDHEIGHVLVSHLMGREVSRTLAGVADKQAGRGDYWTHWWAEEAAVLSFQRLAKFSGTSVQEIAERFKL